MGRTRSVLLAVLAGLGLATGAQSQAARSSAAKAVPPSWTAYAQLVSRTLPVWLDEPGAASLRDRLGVLPPDGTGGRQLALRLWAAPDGTVTRVEASDVSDPAVDGGLRAVMVGRRLPEAPPKPLRWPIRLRLALTPAPAAAGETGRLS